MTLDLAPLAQTTEGLAEGWARYSASNDCGILRDGLIHRFTLAYEVATRTLLRALMLHTQADWKQTSFADQIRHAHQSGLLRGDWAEWQRYRALRSITPQCYDKEKAQLVVAGVPDFVDEAAVLLERLKARNSQ